MSKEERAAIAVQKREEEVAARKKMMEGEREARHLYLEKANLSSSHHQDGRRYWAGRDGEREKVREETLQIKDRGKEMDAIKVG